MSLTLTELQDQLRELEEAYYSGAKRVKFTDREVEYRSAADMERAMGRLRDRIAELQGCPTNGFVQTVYDNGY